MTTRLGNASSNALAVLKEKPEAYLRRLDGDGCARFSLWAPLSERGANGFSFFGVKALTNIFFVIWVLSWALVV